MQKSTCYRLVKNNSTGATEYVLTPSWLEIFTDPDGKEYRIHFHKVNTSEYYIWSATEESTGLKCIPGNKHTKKEAVESFREILPNFNHVMSRYTHYIDKMREFKEKNNIK